MQTVFDELMFRIVCVSVCLWFEKGLAIAASYGLAAAFGWPFTPLSSSLPFLILGLGVDDAFIITGEFQQQTKDHPKESIENKMRHTMKHAGVSILITSLTDITAFSIGASTSYVMLYFHICYTKNTYSSKRHKIFYDV